MEPNIQKICYSIMLSVLTTVGALGQLSLDEFPADRQLYGRVGDERIVELPISGTVTSNTGITSLSAKLLVGTQTIDSDTEILSFSAGQATFSLRLDLPVTRTNHRVELRDDVTNLVLASADFVVAGDVYLINGQSNAEAGYVLERVDRDPFLRGYNPLSDTDDPGWTDIENAACGQWMGRTANALSNEFDLPIGVFNFAEGGRKLEHFQPGATSRNFETSFELLREAGVRDQVKGFLWSQGEADGFGISIKAYRAGLTSLFNAYLDSLSLVDEVYLWQVRAFSCSGQTPNVMEAQRRMNDALEYVTMLSTVNVEGKIDSCHFPYENGREVLGNWMADLLRAEVYGVAQVGYISPTLDSARITGPQKISLFFDLKGANQLEITGAPWDDFLVEGLGIPAVSGSVSGNILDLTFDQPVDAAEGISYYTHLGTAIDYVHSNFGLGVVTFYNESLTVGDGATGSVPDADLRMSTNVSSISVGDDIEVEIELLNQGTQTLRETEVHIPLLASLGYGSGQSVEVTTGNFDKPTDTWTVPFVRPGEQAVLTITYRVLNDAQPITLWGQVICSELSEDDSTPLNGLAGRIHEDDEARVVLGDPSQDCSFSANLISSECYTDSLEYWRLAFETEGLLAGSITTFDFAPTQALNWQNTAGNEISLSFDTLSQRNGIPLRISIQQNADISCASSFTISPPTDCRETDSVSSQELPFFSSLEFSPNPVQSSGVLVLTSVNRSTIQQLTLQDATGRKVYSSLLLSGQNEVPLPALPPGIYVLRVGTSVGKVLIY